MKDWQKARKLEKIFEDILEMATSAKWTGAKRRRFIQQTFDFFEFNEKKNPNKLNKIEWSDYTRFPRTYEGAVMALEVLLEDLAEEYKE